jgi:hypothetical protein
MLSSPISAEQEPCGVINLNTVSSKTFSEDDLFTSPAAPI